MARSRTANAISSSSEARYALGSPTSLLQPGTVIPSDCTGSTTSGSDANGASAPGGGPWSAAAGGDAAGGAASGVAAGAGLPGRAQPAASARTMRGRSDAVTVAWIVG